MGAVREGLERLRSLKNRSGIRMDAEVAEHLELAVEENIRHGIAGRRRGDRRSSASAAWCSPRSSNARRVVCPGSMCCCRICGSLFQQLAMLLLLAHVQFRCLLARRGRGSS